MINFFRSLYIHRRFFVVFGVVILLFVVAFPAPFLFPVAKTVLVLFIAGVLLDGVLIFNPKLKFKCERFLPKVMSLGNENNTSVTVENMSGMAVAVNMVNELPFQLQERDIEQSFRLGSYEQLKFERPIRPLARGEYNFGKVRLYVTSRISLLQRRVSFDLERMVPVYPSLIDVKKYELKAAGSSLNSYGIKKMRRLGHSYEFEQVSQYNTGDDFQSINWKATSRVNQLMVNKYTDEKAQPVYSFIDKSRYMKMPFNGLTLLDYAINASLIITNTALQRQDKAGLLTFSDRIETFIKADNRRNQLNLILSRLYKEEEAKIEANYELLFSSIRKQINGRSLIFFFANFDSIYALERVLPVLRKINKVHLLVVVVFENEELESYHDTPAENVLDIYNKTIARKISDEKRQVVGELKQYGIQIIYTKPEDLTLNTLNKYLELKSRGMI
ncbi:MAG: DUF58 domain-containing protein [Cyclobacteriaceae bacterium]